MLKFQKTNFTDNQGDLFFSNLSSNKQDTFKERLRR